MAFHRIGAHKQNNFAIETHYPLGSPIDHGMKGTKLNLLPSFTVLKTTNDHDSPALQIQAGVFEVKGSQSDTHAPEVHQVPALVVVLAVPLGHTLASQHPRRSKYTAHGQVYRGTRPHSLEQTTRRTPHQAGEQYQPLGHPSKPCESRRNHHKPNAELFHASHGTQRPNL
jgi:hypothetical protein